MNNLIETDDIQFLRKLVREKIVIINDKVEVEICYVCKKLICYNPLTVNYKICDRRPYNIDEDGNVEAMVNCFLCCKPCCHKDQENCQQCNKIYCTNCSEDDFKDCSFCHKKTCLNCMNEPELDSFICDSCL